MMDLEAYLVKNDDIIRIRYSKAQLGDLYRQIRGQTPREGVQLLASLTVGERRAVEGALFSPYRTRHLIALQVLDTNLDRCLRLVLRIFQPDMLNQRFSNTRNLIMLVNNETLQENLLEQEMEGFHGPYAKQNAPFMHAPPPMHAPPAHIHREPQPRPTSTFVDPGYELISPREPKDGWQSNDYRRRKGKTRRTKKQTSRQKEIVEPKYLQETTSGESFPSFRTPPTVMSFDEGMSETERTRRDIMRLFARWTPAEPEDNLIQPENAPVESTDVPRRPEDTPFESQGVAPEHKDAPVESENVPREPDNIPSEPGPASSEIRSIPNNSTH